MANNQKLNIRWANHTFALQKSLPGGPFVDVTLFCEDGQAIKCHRPILSACSAYFDRILSAYPKDLVIFLKNVKYREMKALITFMYTGQVSVDREELPGLCKAAEELEIMGLGLPDEDEEEELQQQPIKRKRMKLPPKTTTGPPVGAKDRAERFKKAAELVHSGISTRAAADHFDIASTTLFNYMKKRRGLRLPDEGQAGPTQQNGGQPMKKRKRMMQPPKLVKMQHVDNGSDLSLQEEVKAKRRELEAASVALVLPPKSTTGHPVDAEDRAERLKKASEFVVEGLAARAVAAHFDIPETTLCAHMKHQRPGLRLPDGDEGQVGQPVMSEPPKLVKMERSSSDGSDASAQEGNDEGARDEVKKKKKEKRGIALPPKTTTGPPVDDEDRAKRYAKASQLVLSGITGRAAAAHFDIPRTTLCAYMRRNGLIGKKGTSPSDGSSSNSGGSVKQSPTKSEAGSAASSSNEDFPFFGISDLLMNGDGEYGAMGDAEEDLEK